MRGIALWYGTAHKKDVPAVEAWHAFFYAQGQIRNNMRPARRVVEKGIPLLDCVVEKSVFLLHSFLLFRGKGKLVYQLFQAGSLGGELLAGGGTLLCSGAVALYYYRNLIDSLGNLPYGI